jgi:outer membrane protein assembly factor BamB
MKRIKLPSLLLFMLLATTLLSACASGTGAANSWPGLLVDNQSGMAYLASGNFVYSVNLSNGSEKWRYPAKASSRTAFFAQPTLTDDGQLIEGCYDYSLYSINPQNGQQNWSFTEASDKFIGAALAWNNNIYAPNTNNSLYALNSNGNQRWVFVAKHSIWAKPITDEKNIYVASMDHRVYALNPDTGKPIWETGDLGGAITHSFSYDSKSVLYVGTIGDDVSAINTENGKILWQTPLKGWVWSKIVISNGTLFVGDQNGNVYALDAQSGTIKWQIQPDTSDNRAVISTPVVVDTTLYFASQAGILYAVNTADGKPVWNKTIGGNIYTDLELSGDTILIAPLNFDAALVAVDLQGNVRWTYTPAKQ